MNKVDRIIKDLESELKDKPEALALVNELVTFIGDLETKMSMQDVEINRLRNSISDTNWRWDAMEEYHSTKSRDEWQ